MKRGERQEFKLVLPEAAALAVLKCLEVEGAVTSGPRRQLQVFFDTAERTFAHRALRLPLSHAQVSALSSSGPHDDIVVSVEELAEGTVRTESLALPRAQ